MARRPSHVLRRALLVLVGGAVLSTTVGAGPPSPAASRSPAPLAMVGARTASADAVEQRSAFRLAVVGDIARAGGGQEITAALAEQIDPRRVVIPGDVAYPTGSATDFAQWFHPSYGVRFEGRMWPVPGNHEYNTPGAQGYLDYFGIEGPTWWVHLAGPWVIIGLDSELMSDPAQLAFLVDALATHDGRPTVVTYHRARFSTGEHGDDPVSRAYWRVAARDSDVRIVLWGHDHDYERMSIPVAGRATPVQAFVVGTGGGNLRGFAHARREITKRRLAFHYGVLDLRLGSNGWRWTFLTDDGRTVDTGSRPL